MKNLLFVCSIISILFACDGGYEMPEKSKAASVSVPNESYAESRIRLNKTLETSPNNFQALLESATLALEHYDYAMAYADAAKAFRIDSSSHRARMMYALSIINQGNRTVADISRAQSYLQIVVNKDPKNVKAMVGLANTYALQQDFDEARLYETGRPGNYIVKIENPEQAESIAKEIDELFKNSLDETKTSTEEAFSRMFAEQIGNIGLIINSVLAASFFTILLLTGNTMSQAVRERTPELGALKAVGFSDRLIMLFVLAESFFLCVAGALIGVLIAYLLFPLFSGLAIGFSGEIEFSISIVISAILVAFITAVVSGVLPAYSAMRLNVVDALRKN